jgi:F-type H+-transporting ATPase subunit epsilon
LADNGAEGLAMAGERTFTCEILSPAGRVETLEAHSAVFPAADGMMGMWAGRAPAVVLLGAGPLRIDAADGGKRQYFIAGGVAQINESGLTLLADECTPKDDLDSAAVWDEIQTARRMPAETDEEVAARDRAVEIARAKFRLAQEGRPTQSWGVE